MWEVCMMEGCSYPDGKATCKVCGKVNHRLKGCLAYDTRLKNLANKQMLETKRIEKAARPQ